MTTLSQLPVRDSAKRVARRRPHIHWKRRIPEYRMSWSLRGAVLAQFTFRCRCGAAESREDYVRADDRWL